MKYYKNNKTKKIVQNNYVRGEVYEIYINNFNFICSIYITIYIFMHKIIRYN